MKKNYIGSFLAIVILAICSTMVTAADSKVTHRPFVSAQSLSGSIDESSKAIKQKLAAAGFAIAGEYTPYKGAHIIVITSNALQEHASRSTLGAFGAALRVTLTQDGNEVQIGYTNPTYLSHVYRMEGDMADIKDQLAKAIGSAGDYGSEDGLTESDLRKYHYKWLMPYFTDTIELKKYSSQKTALEKIHANLAQNKSGASHVYEITLPGKDETVIGVALTGAKGNDCSSDAYIMSRIDFKKVKSTGHLPYEMVVSNGVVHVLPAEFRIAINFPDLSMMGSNSFASIMCAPDSIKSEFAKAIGAAIDSDF